VPLAERFRGTDVIVRFIEYMDVGSTNGWHSAEVAPADEIFAAIGAHHALEPLPAATSGEVATHYRYRDGAGEIGVITSVSLPFCGDCSRARLSADGQLHTCLFSSSGLDLRAMLCGGATGTELRDAVAARRTAREDPSCGGPAPRCRCGWACPGSRCPTSVAEDDRYGSG
jgi:cyclic pyranopterin phosphate synthase